MNIVLNVGRNSDGSRFYIDVNTHLFISYVDENTLIDFFSCSIEDINKDVGIEILIYSKLHFLNKVAGELKFLLKFFTPNEPGDCFVERPTEFLNYLYKNVARKKDNIDKLPQRNLSRKNKKSPVTIVFVENIWEWVILANRSTKVARQIAEILISGPSHQVFCIFGSCLPYRNLIPQLLSSRPGRNEIIHASENNLENVSITHLGHQIVFTADGITYFKEKGSMTFKGLY